MLSGENGILNRAGESVEEQRAAQVDERVKIWKSENMMADVLKEEPETTLDQLLSQLLADGLLTQEEKTSVESVGKVTIGSKTITFVLEGESSKIIEPTNKSDWIYEVDASTNTITIKGYKGSETEVTIPNYIDGVPVKKITGKDSLNKSIWDPSICYGNAPYGNAQTTITKVIISEGIEEIDGSFQYSFALKEVVIPESVTTMSNSPFYRCDLLQTIITKPTGRVEPLDVNDWLWDVDASTNTVTIKGYKGRATEVTVPNYINGLPVKKLTTTGNGYKFWDASITTKTNGYEYAQTTITKLVISEGIEEIDGSFPCSFALREVVLPESLKTMKNQPFWYCSALTTINIPSGVTSLGGERAFYYCTSLKSITIPSGVEKINSQMFYECTALSDVTISNGVKSIESYAFYRCSNLKNITIPESITSIGTFAFSYCTKLENVVLQEGLTSIGNYAFEYCNLTNVTIPKGVTTIGYCAFIDISGTTITINIPYKQGETLPTGWDANWNKSGGTVVINYAQ